MNTLACPFCDENTSVTGKKMYTSGKIYTPRICKMGHKVYSVEEIPENQSEIEEELENIRAYKKAQRIQAQKKKWEEKKAKRVSSI